MPVVLDTSSVDCASVLSPDRLQRSACPVPVPNTCQPDTTEPNAPSPNDKLGVTGSSPVAPIESRCEGVCVDAVGGDAHRSVAQRSLETAFGSRS
jgi:hypothetical protein